MKTSSKILIGLHLFAGILLAMVTAMVWKSPAWGWVFIVGWVSSFLLFAIAVGRLTNPALEK